MKPIVTVIIISSLALLTGCSTLEAFNPWGKHESAPPSSQSSSSTQITKWKTVSRMEDGQWVTYQVPVTEKIPNTSSPTNSQAQNQQDQSIASEEDEGSPTPINDSTSNTNPETATTSAATSASAQQENTGNQQISSKPGEVSEEAEISLGQAEIIVREAQSRYQTAETMLELARNAAKSGNNADVIKYSRTAIALSRPH
ncbi:MAG: hypothetical protein KGI54_12435 [Pseudomonadota bacterium]|nr:hypothetical protein [Pseudomonadota bacterium]